MEVTAKGIDQRITLSEVLGIGGRHKLSVPQTEEALVPLADEVPFMYTLVDGAQLSGETFKGSLTKLSERRAEACLENSVPTMSNLRMQLIGPEGQEIPGALSCKVVAPMSENSKRYAIHFTSKSQEIETFLRGLARSQPGETRPASTSLAYNGPPDALASMSTGPASETSSTMGKSRHRRKPPSRPAAPRVPD
jgi:hypothetical protein